MFVCVYDAHGCFVPVQLEIDEYQNYDKAAGALSEALKCLSKTKGVNEVELQDRIAFLQQRIVLVKRFASARKYVCASLFVFSTTACV